MPKQLMHLKILLPFHIFMEESGVSRIVAETGDGSFGLLPHRLDCVAALVPGILVFQKDGADEVYVAVNEGVMVKSGLEVLVSVREAMLGTDLAKLHETVQHEYLVLNEQEHKLRTVMAKMENGFISRLIEVHDE